MSESENKKQHIQTILLHSDRRMGDPYAAAHMPIYKSVQFAYEDSQAIADAFQGKSAGYTYARSNSPTLAALDAKITLLEGGVGTVSYATGMAAIGTALLALLKAGEHIVVSQFLFGNSTSLFNTFALHGIDITYVDATDAQAVAQAVSPNTRMVFVETIANPRTQVADLAGIGELCRAKKILFVVDNTMATPALVQAKDFGAGIVMNSLSKGLSGHAVVLGGSLTDTGEFDWSDYPNIYEGYRKGDAKRWGLTQLRKKGLRDLGTTLSADAANSIALGLETFFLRNERACANALQLAEFLQQHPTVAHVDYPGLSEHPQHERAQALFNGRGFGTLLSFTVKADAKPSFDVIDALRTVMISTHLGDNRTMALPVAQTIYCEMPIEQRQAWGISDGLIRVSVGIEDINDLISDFNQALAS